MSEYQYYEFVAIDRRLSDKEMRELRSYSTRARITPTSFVNDYSWGNFKGNEDIWMEKYFDAFLYVANWGTHILKLRVPEKLLAPKLAQKYLKGQAARVRAKGGKVILSFDSEDEEGSDWVEAEGLLASLIPLHAELARGDLRSLYLGWLRCAADEEFADEEEEPPVPAGLQELTAAQASLVDFLRIDPELLEVAAEASPPRGELQMNRGEVSQWLASLSGREKDELLAEFLVEEDATLLAAQLRRRMQDSVPQERAMAPKPRTVGSLLDAAYFRREARERAEAERVAQEQAEKEAEARRAREQYLDGLAKKQPATWRKIETLIATKQSQKYDEAIQLLVDLHDLAARGDSAEFQHRLTILSIEHARKPSFIKKLVVAGLHPASSAEKPILV